MIVADIASELKKLLLTAVVAIAAGWICLRLTLPAPFLLGSLFGVWALGALFPPLGRNMGIPRWFYVPTLIGLAVLMGANFTSEIIAQLEHWIVTASAMVVTTALVTGIGMLFLIKLKSFPPLLSFFCSIPGGQVEAVLLARHLTDKDYVVALFHLVRLVLIFSCTPLLLGHIGGIEAIKTSNETLESLPHLFDLPLASIAWFVFLAIGGFFAAKALRLPIPHLLGPLCLSIAAHLTGLLHLPRINEFILLAQIAVGGGIGARLAQVQWKEIAANLRIACLHTTFILLCYFVIVYVISKSVSDYSFILVLLAFIPGGIYEVTLLALMFDYDVAFIAFHHTMRLLLIFACLPIAVKLLAQPKST